MPVLIALLGVAAAAYFWINRARNAAHMTGELLDVANDVRLAARRFGFTRRTNLHPAEAIEDPNIAIAAMGWAFIELDDLPSSEQQLALKKALHKHQRISLNDAEELMVLGRWMVTQCGGAEAAISRLSRKLARLQGKNEDLFTPLLSTLSDVASAGSERIGTRQGDALNDIRRAFRIS